MADVPEDLVARRVEQAVQHGGQLAGAEVGAEVAADLADHVDDQLAHLLRDLGQLLVGAAAEIGGAGDRVEQARVVVGPSLIGPQIVAAVDAGLSAWRV